MVFLAEDQQWHSEHKSACKFLEVMQLYHKVATEEKLYITGACGCNLVDLGLSYSKEGVQR